MSEYWAFFPTVIAFSVHIANFKRAWPALTLVIAGVSASTSAADTRPLERSFWVHASLGTFTQKNWFGLDYPTTPLPNRAEVENATRVLAQDFAANRLYLVYHRELPVEDGRQLFTWWHESCPKDVEIVPALVLWMHDKARSAVFAADELAAFADFPQDRINGRHLAIDDIAVRGRPADALTDLTRRFPQGLIRIGLQPGESLAAPFVQRVADTWSALCHGRDNTHDWQQPGFGAATLRGWVAARNSGLHPVAWNLVTVAWDYSCTDRGGYPG